MAFVRFKNKSRSVIINTDEIEYIEEWEGEELWIVYLKSGKILTVDASEMLTNFRKRLSTIDLIFNKGEKNEK